MTPFILKHTTPTETGFRAVMAPDMESAIYTAHFPGNPVTPGACLVEAVCNLMERHCECKLRLRELKNVKFISVIVPDRESKVVFDVVCCNVPDSPITAKATVNNGDVICAKMSLVFERKDH